MQGESEERPMFKAPEAVKKGTSILGLDRLAQEKRAAKEKEEAAAKKMRLTISGMGLK